MEISGFWKENGVFSDVAADFRELLSDGMTRTQITAHILDEYQAEAEDADDGIFVLAGLAYAQIQSGGILKRTKEAVLSSCDTVTAYISGGGRVGEEAKLFLSAIDNLKAYAEHGKPEKRERLSCDWKVNDVYALRLHGEDYKSSGLEGEWLFFRTVGYLKLGRDTFPYVYISITHTDILPQTRAQLAEAVCHAEYLPVMEWKALEKHRKEPGESAESTYSIAERTVYRAVLTWQSQKEFLSFDFIYAGSFGSIDPPADEFQFPPDKEIFSRVPMPLSMLEHDICRRYEQYIQDN